MAKKKRSGPNKSAAIREVLDADPTATASVIIPILAKKGIDVNATLVSNVRSNYDGARKSPKRKTKTRKKMHPNVLPAKRKSVISYDDLLQAKQAAEMLGGIDKAIAALNALKELT